MSLAIGLPAPDFSATAYDNGDFKSVSLKDFKGKYMVLFFYPLDFTFVCPTEILAFSEKAPALAELDCALVGCSTFIYFQNQLSLIVLNLCSLRVHVPFIFVMRP